ncbi:alpha/beta hydrolase family esterase [Corynebacterium coyleae]|uniref:alpha/beta hydrolase family esterase n=1 Tax=Corynebacterium coyleae TaxID=53374 RepID=UPI00254CD2AD|nr:dienelactone hydrolase family protein [Corynebacterium coyleae]MDK8241362.1 alpha/beta hydrolase-fold protein [Corynebacterium coyleae]
MKIKKRAVAAALTFSLMASPAITPEAKAADPSVSASVDAAELVSALSKLLPMNNPQVKQALGVLTLIIAGILVAVPMAEAGSSIRNGAVGDKAPGKHTRRIVVDGTSRSYDVVLPSNYSEGVAYPVILGFGGWQHTASQTRDYQKFETAIDNTIVIYAQGVDNAWAGAPYARTSLNEDIAYTRAIIDDAATQYGADPNRVVAAGLSNGGGFAAALACHAPDTVKAVASVAGAFYNPTVTGCTSGAVPTLIMHGTNDNVVGYNGGIRHGAFYESVDSVMRTMASKNKCLGTTTRSRSDNVTTFEAQGCDAATRVERIEGGIHTWFTDPSATAHTVRFLLPYL